jgi:hypothetical protein
MPDTDQFDAGPDEWRKKFWNNDAKADEATSKPKQKPNAPTIGTNRIWACCGCAGDRRQCCRSKSSARFGSNGSLMQPGLQPARSITSLRHCSPASRR